MTNGKIPHPDSPPASLPAREAPVTRAPVTRAPVTRAPVTRAPVTRAPVTRAPVTQAVITRAVTPLYCHQPRGTPAETRTTAIDSELLMGETVSLQPAHNGWGYVHNASDQYRGYVALDALAPRRYAPDCLLINPLSPVLAAADVKARCTRILSGGSRIATGAKTQGFVAVQLPDAGTGWISVHHTTALPENMPPADTPAAHARAFVAQAQRFCGTPYIWGGRSGWGLDCSALVQLCLLAVGIPCPRDTREQEHALGRDTGLHSALAAGDERHIRHGDLIFWPGHVGIYDAADGAHTSHPLEPAPGTLLHANAGSMNCCRQPLHAEITRIHAETGTMPTRVRRLFHPESLVSGTI